MRVCGRGSVGIDQSRGQTQHNVISGRSAWKEAEKKNRAKRANRTAGSGRRAVTVEYGDHGNCGMGRHGREKCR